VRLARFWTRAICSRVKTVYLCLPFAVLLGVEAVVTFAGCSSSTSTKQTMEGGPACEPSCPDVSEGGPLDVLIPSDGGSTCDSACAKQIAFSGCPYPGCPTECARESMACILNFHELEFNELLACESTSTFTCQPTDSGLLPIATACGDAAAAVALGCNPAAGDGGNDAGSCTATVDQAMCDECCMGQYIEGYDTYNLALTSCACEVPGVCASPCASTLCMDNLPDGGDTCSKCLAKSLGPDGGCAGPVATGCAMDPKCRAYEGCLKTSGCASKAK
jgi:hypothetical protein